MSGKKGAAPNEPSLHVIHHAPFGYMTLNAHGILLYQNRYVELLFEQVLGHALALGERVADALPVPELQRTLHADLQTARHQPTESTLRLGSRTLRLSATPLPDGQQIALLVQDNTDAVALQQQLAKADVTRQALMSICPDPVFICRHKGEIRQVNAAALQYIKRPKSRVLGGNIYKLFHQIFVNQLDRTIINDYEYQLEALLNQPLPVGSPRTLQWQLGSRTEELICCGLPEPEGYALLIRDLSAQKLAAAAETHALALCLQTEQQTLEAERSRMSRDLHDGLAQWTAAAQLHAEALRFTYLPTDTLPPQHEALMEALRHLGDELHRLTLNTQPAALEEKGLLTALHILMRNVERANPSLVITDSLPDTLPPLPPLVPTAIYRVVQESLHNTSRHAHATNVRVQLSVLRRHVLLLIEDNGRGFDLAVLVQSGKLGRGLHNMHQRAKAIGAELELESRPGHGTSLLMRVAYG